MWIIAPLVCGLIFGAGLLISGMMQPTKVLGFLDIFGAWDPSLLVVMASALAVSVPGFMLADRSARPWFAGQYFRPGNAGIDLPLVTGAAVFGIGWGLVGLCPGPALANLGTLSPGIIVFVVAMAIGIVAHDAWKASRPMAQRDGQLARATDG
jgi:uncharacterized membrane protein YedE/YeeE